MTSESRDAWLIRLEGLLDPATQDRLDHLGLASGWRVLEVGAGRGSIVDWLATRVGPAGRVVAMDLDTSLLDASRRPNVDVVAGDITHGAPPGGPFDLVHCRAVLVHVADRELALAQMVAALRPGGLLLAEEPWFDAGLLAPDPTLAAAVRAFLDTAPNVDGAFARRLPTALATAGLERIEADGRIEFFNGGSDLARFQRDVLAGGVAHHIASGLLARADVAPLLARLDAPDCCEACWPRIAAWGRRPAPS